MANLRLSNLVLRAIDRAFMGPDRQLVVAELEATNLPLAGPAERERVHFAVLLLAHGSAASLRGALELARVDWRDVLVAAGLASENWRDALVESGILTPRD